MRVRTATSLKFGWSDGKDRDKGGGLPPFPALPRRAVPAPRSRDAEEKGRGAAPFFKRARAGDARHPQRVPQTMREIRPCRHRDRRRGDDEDRRINRSA